MFLSVILEPYATSNVSSGERNHAIKSDVLQTKWVFVKVVANKMGLKERAHLCIPRTGVVQDEKVDFETGHVDDNGQDDQTENPRSPMA